MDNTNIQKTDAIILRRYPFRETSFLLILYTKDFGKIKAIIKGVRGPRAQFGSFPEILTLSKIVFYKGRRSEFSHIIQCDLIDLFQKIRLDLERTGYATYLIELVDAATPFNDKDEGLFDLLSNSLKLLCFPGSAKRIARIFEIKLLLILGLMPTFDGCFRCGKAIEPVGKFSLKSRGLLCKDCFFADREALDISCGTINFIRHIKKIPYEKTSRIKVSKQVGEEVEAILRKFLDLHINKKLKTLDFLEKIGA